MQEEVEELCSTLREHGESQLATAIEAKVKQLEERAEAEVNAPTSAPEDEYEQ